LTIHEIIKFQQLKAVAIQSQNTKRCISWSQANY